MNDGGITYGPSGTSFAVWDGRRRVQTCRTLLGAKVEATKLTARLGGEAVEVGGDTFEIVVSAPVTP